MHGRASCRATLPKCSRSSRPNHPPLEPEPHFLRLGLFCTAQTRVVIPPTGGETTPQFLDSHTHHQPFPHGVFLDTSVPNINREGGNMTHSIVHISTQPPYFAGCPIGFSGWTDDFERNIAAIQFSLDGGEHWTEYSTPGVSAERGVRWQFAFTPPHAGRYLLNVRARNGSDAVSDLVSVKQPAQCS